MKKGMFFFFLVLLVVHVESQIVQRENKQERILWYQDLAFGQFIHWNVDGSLGAVISHSLAASSEDYAKKYFTTVFFTGRFSLFLPASDSIGAFATSSTLSGEQCRPDGIRPAPIERIVFKLWED